MENKHIIESVLCLLAMDGAIGKEEIQFFKDLCERLEVSKEERDTILARARQGKGRVHLPEEEADKKRLLYFLVQAAVVDGKVSSNERHVLDTVVDKLGMSREEVEEFLQSRLQEVQKERYTPSSKQRPMVCPKCGYEQPTGYRCKRCGIIFEKYKQAKGPSDIDKLKDILSSSNIIEGEDS